MKQTPLIKETATKYAREYRSLPTWTLARLLCKMEPVLFPSLNAARCAVRSIRGAHGAYKRNQAVPDLVRDQDDALECQRNPFGLPPNDVEDWAPYKFPVTKGRGLVIADPHVPFHSTEALSIILKYAEERKSLDFILINGDFGDHYQLSRFLRDPRERRWVEEIETQRSMLAAFTLLKGSPKVFLKAGNHDNRLNLYLKRAAPDLYGCDDFTIQRLLRLESLGVEFIEHDHPIHVGKHLNILHGHENQNGSGITVNPARTAFLRAKACVMVAHSHQVSHHNENDIRGTLISSWSIGCTCQLHPEYARFNNWANGGALLEIDGDDFVIENKRIVNGVMV